MENVTRVGIDLAKKVFHVTAADAAGAVVERRRLGRAGLQSYLARLPQGCVVAMEACGGAHHWARLASRLGHRAVLMSPQFVAPYVKSNKNDVLDADAIAEASSRPTMRHVPVKSVPQEQVQQLALGLGSVFLCSKLCCGLDTGSLCPCAWSIWQSSYWP